MNIIYKLPFPDEICHKILFYACNSHHIDLQEEIFKRALSIPIYQKLVEKGGIIKNVHGHITSICIFDEGGNDFLDDFDRKSITFDIQVLPKSLISLYLNNTGVTGDIQVLQEFPNLISFSLARTGVTGDIKNLPTNLIGFRLSRTGVTGDIQNLSKNLSIFDLRFTGVTGDIQVLKELNNLTIFSLFGKGIAGDIKILKSRPNLTRVDLSSTRVTGNICSLTNLPNLTYFDFAETDVTGDKKAFTKYRKAHGFKKCNVYM